MNLSGFGRKKKIPLKVTYTCTGSLHFSQIQELAVSVPSMILGQHGRANMAFIEGMQEPGPS